MKAPVREEDVQRTILEGLLLYGYKVLQTTNRGIKAECPSCKTPMRLHGGYGATRGVPDLLVGHNTWPKGCLLGLEVKGPETKLSLDQRVLEAGGQIVVVRSWEEACQAVQSFKQSLGVRL